MELHQVDCFKIHMRFWKFLGVWPGDNPHRYYKYYSPIFVTTFYFLYESLSTINFYTLPRQLDIFVEEMIFYFTELSVSAKVITFLVMHKKIRDLLDMLESDIFQPDDANGKAIIKRAKKFNVMYWTVYGSTSATSNLTHVLSPLAAHLLKSADLFLPLCAYSFFSDEFIQANIYPLYAYQCIGMHFHMLINVNFDSFFLGLMIFVIAQLDILDDKLRRVTDIDRGEDEDSERSKEVDDDKEIFRKINQCIIHYTEVDKFCSLVEEVFSMSIFAQFSLASCIICVCLFRFTMDAPLQYYIFLGTYIIVMILQILVPCWFGTKIMDKSNLLSFATYNCDWTSRSRRFKSNLRLFVERANKPLSITGGKMFCLSLSTFTSIMNSAYSFFTVLQHMQTRE